MQLEERCCSRFNHLGTSESRQCNLKSGVVQGLIISCRDKRIKTVQLEERCCSRFNHFLQGQASQDSAT